MVAERLRHYRPEFVVLDTVMLAKSGDPLLAPEAVASIRRELLPLVSIITPEPAGSGGAAGVRAGGKMKRRCASRGRGAAGEGCRAVLMKGGHLSESESPDWLFTAEGEQRAFTAPRVATRHTHGTGCTLPAALARRCARARRLAATRWPPPSDYLQHALQQADTLEVGHGIGRCIISTPGGESIFAATVV